ncbi:hypothetical protein ACE0DR_28900 [Azotobacter sp. CWF10]
MIENQHGLRSSNEPRTAGVSLNMNWQGVATVWRVFPPSCAQLEGQRAAR